MQEVEGIFAEAIKVEPNGLEAFAQYAQLKSMLGEYEASLTYLEKALGNARSRDEVQELCVMRAQTQAQCKAIEEFRGSV
jgi:tetratricopeptide (TPR) repeat protein